MALFRLLFACRPAENASALDGCEGGCGGNGPPDTLPDGDACRSNTADLFSPMFTVEAFEVPMRVSNPQCHFLKACFAVCTICSAASRFSLGAFVSAPTMAASIFRNAVSK